MFKNKIEIILTGLLIGLTTSAIPLAAQDAGNSASNKKRLPAIAPIDPSNKAEKDVVTVPDIYNDDSGIYQYYRESLDQKVISTAERDRLEAIKRRQERAKMDPMDRPSADGSKFIDIYAPAQIFRDGKAFHDANDPDDKYAEAENSYLAKAVQQVQTAVMLAQLFSGSQQNDGSNGYPGGASSSMLGGGGYGTTANQPVVKPENNKKNDTKLIFEASDGTNPFATATVPEINAETAFDFFKADREFKEQPATTGNAAYGSSTMGPGPMGPGSMGPGPMSGKGSGADMK